MHIEAVQSREKRGWSTSIFLRLTEMLYLPVFTQFRTQNRCALLLELLYPSIVLALLLPERIGGIDTPDVHWSIADGSRGRK